MLAKIGFVTGVIALSTFMMGRVESLVAHHSFAGSTACAQLWTDPADDPDVDSQPAAVPDVSGSYSGTIQDAKLGSGNIAADISQSGSDLTGGWEATFGGPGTLKGKVRPNSKVHARLKITGQGGCGLNIQGTFQNGNEIKGKYQVTGCKKSDHGTFDTFR